MAIACSPVKKTTDNTTNTNPVMSITDSLSYALGIVQASELKKQDLKISHHEDYHEAFTSVMNGRDGQMDVETAYQVVQEKVQEIANNKSKMAKQEGEAYLAKNGERPEVTTLASGLQYEVIKAGDGPIPTASQKVTTHYTGMLIDGTVFDSSVQRGEPISFPVNGVIKGWQEALQLMPVGSKWKLFIPQDLAYGERGAGNVIPPFSTLIFEIELLGVE